MNNEISEHGTQIQTQNALAFYISLRYFPQQFHYTCPLCERLHVAFSNWHSYNVKFWSTSWKVFRGAKARLNLFPSLFIRFPSFLLSLSLSSSPHSLLAFLAPSIPSFLPFLYLKDRLMEKQMIASNSILMSHMPGRAPSPEPSPAASQRGL